MTIENTSLTTVPQAITTASGTKVCSVIYFLNLDASTQKFNLWLVPNGSSVNNVNKIYANVSVTSEDTFVVDMERIILENGDAIWASATANSAVMSTINTFSQ